MVTHQDNRRNFAILIIVVQIVVIVMYGVFVRDLVHNRDSQNVNYYAMYQDVNVMMLIGFGCLMTYVKHYSWSALSYTFMINAVVVQLYLLLQPFWLKVFNGGWDQKIQIVQRTFTGASYAVAASLISLGAILGRVGPFQCLIMAIIQVIAFTLNKAIIFDVIGAFDAGGSTDIHVFGAYFGLVISLIIGKLCKPLNRPEESYYSNMFAMIGTFFLWMFWPSFNAGVYPQTPYQKSVVISNTVVSLTGSCLGTFIISALSRQKLSIDDILNATLAGGVIIGAPCGLFTNPAASLCIGIFGGIVSTLGYRYLQGKLLDWIGLHDSCGINNLHGIPGILGGIFSAIAIASYASDPLTNAEQKSYLQFYPKGTDGLNIYGRTFYQQGGIQIAAIFISMGIGIAFGILTGYILRCFYAFEPKEFYKDNIYFEAVFAVDSPDNQPQIQLPQRLEANSPNIQQPQINLHHSAQKFAV